MAKKKANRAITEEGRAPTALPPVAPPRKNVALLALSIALVAVWLLILAWLALFGEARFGE